MLYKQSVFNGHNKASIIFRHLAADRKKLRGQFSTVASYMLNSSLVYIDSIVPDIATTGAPSTRNSTEKAVMDVIRILLGHNLVDINAKSRYLVIAPCAMFYFVFCKVDNSILNQIRYRSHLCGNGRFYVRTDIRDTFLQALLSLISECPLRITRWLISIV